MKKIGIFWDIIEQNSNLTQEDKFCKVGLNTGNMIFIRSLMSILKPTILPRWTMNTRGGGGKYFESTDFDSFVTTDLIWITPNCEYPHVWQALKRIGDKPLVPISVGLQNSSRETSFAFAPDTIRLLHTLQERSVLGVRGEYTADVLKQNGIDNIQVIGCPSMFYDLQKKLNISYSNCNIKDLKTSCNFRTFYGRLSISERHFLTYAANHNWDFVEQTQHKLSIENISNDSAQFAFFSKWLNQKTQLFFSPDEWATYIKNYQFSIGSRFHGNVIALTNGVPALTMAVDSRMSEMCEFFHMPTFNIKEFDMNKPIEYYYEKADTTDFLSTYPIRLANFKRFLKKNKLI